MLRRKGLGDSKAASVLASLELAKRLARAEVPSRRPLRNPWAVVRSSCLASAQAG
jgi:hypothetical protein